MPVFLLNMANQLHVTDLRLWWQRLKKNETQASLNTSMSKKLECYIETIKDPAEQVSHILTSPKILLATVKSNEKMFKQLGHSVLVNYGSVIPYHCENDNKIVIKKLTININVKDVFPYLCCDRGSCCSGCPHRSAACPWQPIRDQYSQYQPIRGQYSGHVICLDQSEASI